MIIKAALYGSLVLLAVSLSGCGNDSAEELGTWMAGVKKDTRVVTPKLAEPKTFEPAPYQAQGDIDPFNPDKLIAVLASGRCRIPPSSAPEPQSVCRD